MVGGGGVGISGGVGGSGVGISGRRGWDGDKWWEGVGWG